MYTDKRDEFCKRVNTLSCGGEEDNNVLMCVKGMSTTVTTVDNVSYTHFVNEIEYTMAHLKPLGDTDTDLINLNFCRASLLNAAAIFVCGLKQLKKKRRLTFELMHEDAFLLKNEFLKTLLLPNISVYEHRLMCLYGGDCYRTRESESERDRTNLELYMKTCSLQTNPFEMRRLFIQCGYDFTNVFFTFSKNKQQTKYVVMVESTPCHYYQHLAEFNFTYIDMLIVNDMCTKLGKRCLHWSFKPDKNHSVAVGFVYTKNKEDVTHMVQYNVVKDCIYTVSYIEDIIQEGGVYLKISIESVSGGKSDTFKVHDVNAKMCPCVWYVGDLLI